MAAGRAQSAISGMIQALKRGYATASTNTGHDGPGGDASFAPRTPRESHRLRLPRGPRNDREGQGDHRRVLRQRSAPVLLERMLIWR